VAGDAAPLDDRERLRVGYGDRERGAGAGAPGAGRAVKTIAATNAATPATTARQSERPRAFITYLSTTPAMQTRISTSQPSGWP
jgi:hypothetical protein